MGAPERWWRSRRFLAAAVTALVLIGVIVAVVAGASGGGGGGPNPIRTQEALQEKDSTSSNGLNISWECHAEKNETFCVAHWTQALSNYALAHEYLVKSAGAGCFVAHISSLGSEVKSAQEYLRKEAGLPETIEAC